MKKIYLTLLAVILVVVPAFAFTYDLQILDKKGVAKLSDEKLIDNYTDTIVELEASRAFHATSGFSTKEYDAYKALIKFRILLVMEIHSRNLEMPQIEH